MNFSKLKLSKEMLQNLDAIGYERMTQIQADALPFILDGKDVIAQAKTGSGKTATFGIGLLEKLDVKKFRIQTLVLSPTRELADQVAKELRNLAKFKHNIKILTLCGGASFNAQVSSLAHHAHIVVGTPGRLLKHLKKGTLNLEHLNTLVLDEADRMLDMGFIEDIQTLLTHAPKDRQTLLFSATYTDEVLAISKTLQRDAVEVKTTSKESSNKIDEQFFLVEESKKVDTLIKLFYKFKPKNVIVFTNTKIQAKELAEDLSSSKIDALAIHGDLEQYDRDDVLVQFSNSSCPILVATDVAARGLDIKELCMVVNYDIPNTIETYTHRIGRTARAGEKGIAITLYNPYDDITDYEDDKRTFSDTKMLENVKNFEMKPQNVTLVIEGGKRDKLRAGDILGALTSDKTLQGSSIGKIDIYNRQSYVAIQREFIEKAHQKLSKDKIKNKNFSVWIL